MMETLEVGAIAKHEESWQRAKLQLEVFGSSFFWENMAQLGNI